MMRGPEPCCRYRWRGTDARVQAYPVHLICSLSSASSEGGRSAVSRLSPAQERGRDYVHGAPTIKAVSA